VILAVFYYKIGLIYYVIGYFRQWQWQKHRDIRFKPMTDRILIKIDGFIIKIDHFTIKIDHFTIKNTHFPIKNTPKHQKNTPKHPKTPPNPPNNSHIPPLFATATATGGGSVAQFGSSVNVTARVVRGKNGYSACVLGDFYSKNGKIGRF
jgi:hypothetical protein